MSRRTFSILGAAGFLAVTVSAVYLLIAPSSLRHQVTSKAFERPIKTGPGEGELAPNFSAPRFSGGDLSFIDLRGEGGGVEFFFPWWTPCLLAGHGLEGTDRKNKTKGIVFFCLVILPSAS